MAGPQVLVVGGGPAGAATAHWLARDGVEVVVAEKSRYPRPKTCGDGLTPRAIHQLQEMGFDFSVPEFHRIEGLRAYAGEYALELPWPRHSVYPSWGGVIRRADFDGEVAALAERQGALIRQGTKAQPVVEGGRLVAVDLHGGDGVERVTPRLVVIADGSLSRFGRALGTYRARTMPYGLAARGYFASPASTDRYMESHLGIPDERGRSVSGYGWLFPLGDGTVNVGVGVLSTFRGWKELNTTRLMELLVAALPPYWEITPDDAIGDPRGGKLPMSLSVGPKVGSNWVTVGDAAGAINPFTGEGIEYGFETGRMAARHLAAALASDDPARLHGYRTELEDTYARYNQVARAFVRLIGSPTVMRVLTRAGLRVRPVMELVLKIMANLLDDDDPGWEERAYAFVDRLVEAGPRP